jgi:tellurite resistance protein TerC
LHDRCGHARATSTDPLDTFMEQQLLVWGGFLLFVVAMLAVDLGLFHRKAHVIHMREALTWTAIWISLALAFNAGIAYFWGTQAGVEFLTGYLVEKSLSMDNVFVFLLIFNYFKTPPTLQYKVLFWGIIGAILARSVFIVAGLALLETFHWTMYVFGAFLLGTGLWMVIKKGEQYDPERNPVIRLFRRWIPITESYEDDRFFVRKAGRLVATPLLVVLLAVESSDIVFAVDSIPAIFAITQDHFIVYTSNIFAMLGLRAMYFAVASFMRSFHYLHYGFASIIMILGIKMLVSDVYHVPVAFSLVLIVLILMGSMIASLLRPRAEDLKQLLQRSQRRGLMSFRRLLLLENVFQLERLQVHEAMRRRSRVRVLRADAPWAVNARTMVESRFSRYPLVDHRTDKPLGIVHVKDLLYRDVKPDSPDGWKALARPVVPVREDALLEDLLMTLKTERQPLAVVVDAAGHWTGLATLEDVLEEIVGPVTDEFERAASPPLGSLTPARVTLGLEAQSIDEGIARMICAGQGAHLAGRIDLASVANGRLTSTYLGNGLAVSHGTCDAVESAVTFFGRSDGGMALDDGAERVHGLFVVLLPTRMQHAESDMVEGIASLMGSDYLRERLLQAETPALVVEAVREGMQVA